MNFREIFFGAEKVFNRKVAIFHAAIFFAAVAFLYLFSSSTSPRYFFVGNDSLIFQVVGKCWAQGLLPYVDAFENKGPLLFAIDALGYLLCPRYGIFPLQVPFMYASMLFLWRTIELFWSRRATFLIWLFVNFWRASIFFEGNRTEEYSMPFLLLAAYLFLRRLRDGKNFLPPSVGFAYGLGFGACVMLRTTNGLPICCYVLLTTFVLIRAGVFKNIRQNFLSFCAGFATIVLPFVIYFAANDALYEMLYGTILLNINHVTNYDTHSADFYEYMIPYAVQFFQPMFWLIAASVFLLVLDRKNFLAWSGLVTGATMLLLLFKSRPFVGYLELMIALLPIFFAVVSELKLTLATSGKFSRALYKVLFVAFLTVVGLQVSVLWESFTNLNSAETVAETEETQAQLQNFCATIPVDEKNSVVLWGESLVTSQFMLAADIVPRCRFFGNVACFFGKSDPAVIDEWLETVRRIRPKWIVYGTLRGEFSGVQANYFNTEFRRQRNSDVEKILDADYSLVNEMPLFTQTIRLYRRKER